MILVACIYGKIDIVEYLWPHCDWVPVGSQMILVCSGVMGRKCHGSLFHLMVIKSILIVHLTTKYTNSHSSNNVLTQFTIFVSTIIYLQHLERDISK